MSEPYEKGLILITIEHSNCVLTKKAETNKRQLQCPKNLTFPKAERDQLCPRLVVIVFCLFFSICQSDLIFDRVNQSNS